MDRNPKIEHDGGLGTAVIRPEVLAPPGLSEITPSCCRWPSLAIKDMRMADLDAALAADPLFHLCPDGHRGEVEVRYWYFHPLNFSCRHCSEGGGLRVVDSETVGCRHRMVHRNGHPFLEG